jgi:hypothetical protein
MFWKVSLCLAKFVIIHLYYVVRMYDDLKLACALNEISRDSLDVLDWNEVKRMNQLSILRLRMTENELM